MSGGARQAVVLPGVPALRSVYARGVTGTARRAVARGEAGTDLPAVEHVVTSVPVDVAQLTGYQHLVGEPGTDELPAGFLYVLAFPVITSVIVRPDFPLPLVGMVHLANRVEQRRPVRLGEPLGLRAWAQDLRPHPRGMQVDMWAEATVADEPVWRGVSTYLAKGPGSADGERAGGAVAPGDESLGTDPRDRERLATEPLGTEPLDTEGLAPTAVWRLGADTGRRYAAVSGDANPIHMNRLAAKAFGFPRAIAHGMYTASRALATIGPARGEAFTWDVTFGSPVLLPGVVSVHVARTTTDPGGSDGWRYVGWDARSGRRHFHGGLRPLG